MTRYMQLFLEESEFVQDINHYFVIIPFGTLGVILRYIRDIDVEKAILFHDLILTKHEYNLVHGIVEQESEEDLELCNFDAEKLQECIEFFEDVLIPSLEQETERLMNNFGGYDEFTENFSEHMNDIPNLTFSIWDGDAFNDDPSDIRHFYISGFKNLFSRAILANQRYVVWAN